MKLPYFLTSVPAGFSSPTDDYLDTNLDLNDLIEHPAATYLLRAQGHSMVAAGIFDGDLLIVDRSLTPKQGDVVIAAINGELTCKYLDLKQHCLLDAEHNNSIKIPITEAMDCIIEGVVIHSMRLHRSPAYTTRWTDLPRARC